MESDEKIPDVSQDLSTVHDKFCWYCHLRCLKGCTTCVRSFHKKCQQKYYDHDIITDKDDNADSAVVCEVCRTLEEAKESFTQISPVLGLLRNTIEQILNVQEFKVFKHWPTKWKGDARYSSIIVNPIDLNEISRKIDHRLYDSFYAFIVDIEWIYHNCVITHSEHHEITETAKRLLSFCTFELESILNCSNCYENKFTNPNEWRTMACDHPHLLLWAKLPNSIDFWPVKKGIAYWPAKLLSIIGNNIKVVFFDHPQFEVIPATHCFLYSSTNPSLANARADPKDIEDALEEVNLYSKNVEMKFGRLVTSLANVRFFPIRLKEHLSAMFPDDDGSSKPSPSKSNPAPSQQIPGASPNLSEEDDFESDCTLNQHEIPDIKPMIETPPAELSTSIVHAHNDCPELAKNLQIPTFEMISALESDVQELIRAYIARIEVLNSEKIASNTAQEAEIVGLKAQIEELTTQLTAAKSAVALAILDNSEKIQALEENHAKEIAAIKNAQESELYYDVVSANSLIRVLKENLKNRTTELEDIKQKLEEKHNLFVAELEEKNCVKTKLEQSEKEWQRKLMEMEKDVLENIKTKNELESQLENKYIAIVAEMKRTERTKIEEEMKGKIHCLCGKVVPGVFCSRECSVMWSQYVAGTM